MLVQVKVPYYDLKSNNELRKVGEVLDYADGKRGEELVNKGFVTPISIIKVGDEFEETKPQPRTKKTTQGKA